MFPLLAPDQGRQKSNSLAHPQFPLD
jgi:hypothetical protein